MRIINDHQVNPANDLLVIAAEDAPGSGGANHRYAILDLTRDGNASAEDADGYRASFSKQVILFQNGPISEDGNGVNGFTHEAASIVADRFAEKGPKYGLQKPTPAPLLTSGRPCTGWTAAS